MKMRALGLPDLAAIAFVLVVVIGLSLAFYLVVEKPLLKATRRLGDRFVHSAAAPDRAARQRRSDETEVGTSSSPV